MLINETSRVSGRLSDRYGCIFLSHYSKVRNRVRLISGMPCKVMRDYRIPANGARAIIINRVYASVTSAVKEQERRKRLGYWTTAEQL